MTTAPAMQSFPVMSGEQIQLDFTVLDNDGAVVDLSGGSGRFAMARSPRSSSMAIDSDASPATATITVTDAANGLLNVVMTDENTEALEGDYYYELKWTDSSGRAARAARGWITVERNLI